MDYVIYKRVSTKAQGKTGLGLDAQQTMIDKFLNKDDNVLYEFIEVESGKKKDRPKLAEAIKKAKETNAKLLIAKLDRLARNVSFISTLLDAGVEFVAVDLPQANRFTIHLMSALAEQEARLISQRTKQALAELKKKGVKLGKPENLTSQAIKKGQKAMIENAFNNENNKKAGNLIVLLRQQKMSYKKIADYLNNNNYRTRRGKLFASSTVQMLNKRYKDYFNNNLNN